MMKEGWEYKKLGEIATYVNGFAFKPDQWKESGTPIVRIQNLNNPDAPYNYYDGEVPEKVKIDNGDLLISWSASLGAYIWTRGKAFLNQHIFKVVFDKSDVDKMYLKYAVTSKLDLMARQVHGATMKHIVKKDFDNTKIPYPPLSQQQSIVAELDKINGIIDLKKAQLKDLDLLAQSIFYDMFGDPIENSKGWEVVSFNSVGEFGRGVSKNRPRNAPELLGGTMPLIQTGEVTNSGMYITSYEQTYSELGVSQSKVWQPGTICITIAANIGKCSILTFEACFPDSVVGFVSNGKIENEYSYFVLCSLQEMLERNAPGAAQKNINLKVLNSLKIPLPPLPLQQSFASKIQAIESQKSAIKQSLADVETLLASRMDYYFN